MSSQHEDPILDAYITETSQLVEQLERMILASESSGGLTEETIHEIFRIMHTIKGSSSMMQFHNIATLAHALEDLFSYLRDHPDRPANWSDVSDLMLQGVDFTKVELYKLRCGESADGDAAGAVHAVERMLNALRSGNAEKAPARTKHFAAPRAVYRRLRDGKRQGVSNRLSAERLAD